MRTGHTTAGIYAIRVQGRLEPRWSTWFGGFTLTADPDGTTVITGTVVDQAALHGLLQSLHDLGLPLVSVTRPRDAPHGDLADGAATTAAPPLRPDLPRRDA